MLIPKLLVLNNFMSYERDEFEFINGETTIVVGENLDTPDLRSNGSGKSGFFEGIFFALVGKSIRGVPISDLVRKGVDSGFVELHLDHTNGDKYTIKRNIFVTKTSKIKVHKNGTLVDATEAKTIIFDVMGLTVDDLKEFFIISRDEYKPFFDLTDAKIRAVINRFSNIDAIDFVFDEISKLIKIQEESIKFEEDRMLKLQGATEALENQARQYDATSVRENIQRKIDREEEQLKGYNSKLKDYGTELQELEHELNEVPNVDDIAKKCDQMEAILLKMTEKHQLFSEKRTKFLTILTKSKSQSTKYTTQLLGKIECPSCSHKFLLDGDIDQVTEWLSEAEHSIEYSSDKLNKVDDFLSQLDEKIDSIEEKIKKGKERISASERKKSSLNLDIDWIKHSISNTKQNISESEMEIESLNKSKKAVKEDNSSERDIKDLMKQLKKCEGIISDHQEEINALNEWTMKMKKFKHYLMVQVLDSINNRINIELLSINPGSRIEMEGFRIDSKGNISEKIDTKVFIDGNYIGTYKSFSGGEKGEINGASVIALNKLVMENSECGLDFIGFDEIFERVDPIGIDNIFQYFGKQDKTIMIVSHAKGNKENNCNVVTVEKNNLISKIVS
jgi:DNA repair exonuclease SbcCD ATPase subunit